MSTDGSATMSEDEADITAVSSDSETEGETTKDSQLDMTKTSDQFLTLKDEPNDLLLRRPPVFGDDANGADDDDEEVGEDEEIERPPGKSGRETVKAVRFFDTVAAGPTGSPAANLSEENSSSLASGAFKQQAAVSEQPTKQVKPKAIPIVVNTQNSDRSRAASTRSGLPLITTEKKQVPSQKQPSQSVDDVVSTRRDTVEGDVMLDSALKKRVRKKKKNLWVCLVNCKYDVVHRMAKKYGFKLCDEEDDWNLYWTDFSVGLERVMDMKRYQKINHFPGMSELCRKDLLARNLNKMLKLFPKDYTFFPRTWVLPADYGDLQAYSRTKKNQTYIIKPPASCQGRGIWLTKNPSKIRASEHAVVQTYLRKPFLIDGFKFDLRVYVTVTSCDPLRIFVFKDGLARFATCKYVDPTSNNCDNVYMHVTNYAVQKNSDTYVDDEFTGTKRRISTINRWLREKGYNVDKLWQEIDDVAIKTIISAQPLLRHNYRTCFPNHVQGSACFEVLGFDIVLDRKLRPYVLEVNHSPSFTTDAQIDLDIKEALIYDTLDLINICGVDRKKCLEDEKRRVKERLLQRQTKKDLQDEIEREAELWFAEQEKYEAAHLGNYRRIYPIAGLTEKYDKFFANSCSLFAETAAFRARQECARQQREDLSRKQEQLTALLKKNKDRTLRPESPERGNGVQPAKRRIIRRPPIAQKRLAQMNPEEQAMSDALPSNGNSSIRPASAVDIMKPMVIIDDEEVERLSGLIQRENLIRSLGVVEQVYRLLHGTPGTVSSVKAQPAGGAQYGGHNRISQAQYPNDPGSSRHLAASGLAKKASFAVPVGICLLPAKNAAQVAVTGVAAGQRPRPSRLPPATADPNVLLDNSAAIAPDVPRPDAFTVDASGNTNALAYRKGQSNATSDSGYEGSRGIGRGNGNPALQSQQQRRVLGQPVAQLHIVSGPSEMQTLNRPVSNYLNSDSAVAVAAANASSWRAGNGDLQLDPHMRKLLAMPGSIESVLPQSMQNPLKQNVPLQSSDLIHYQHQTAAAAGSSFLQSIRKRTGSGHLNADPRQVFEWMDESATKENEAGRLKSSVQRSAPQNAQMPARNLVGAVEWPIAEAVPTAYGLQLKGLSLKAPIHP